METGSTFLLQRETQVAQEDRQFNEVYVQHVIAEIKQISGITAEEKPMQNTSSVEQWKQGLEQIRQERGIQYFAFVLGEEYFQARFYMSVDEQDGRMPGFFTTQFEAVKTFLPEIVKDPELAEIFRTSFRLHAETQKIHEEIFNRRPLLSGEALAQKQKEGNLLFEKFETYRLKIEKASKLSPTAVPTSIPKLCIEAVRYEIRSEIVPQAHIQECSICQKDQSQGKKL